MSIYYMYPFGRGVQRGGEDHLEDNSGHETAQEMWGDKCSDQSRIDSSKKCFSQAEGEEGNGGEERELSLYRLEERKEKGYKIEVIKSIKVAFEP